MHFYFSSTGRGSLRVGEAVEFPDRKLHLISSSRKTGLGSGLAVTLRVYQDLVEPQRVLLPWHWIVSLIIENLCEWSLLSSHLMSMFLSFKKIVKNFKLTKNGKNTIYPQTRLPTDSIPLKQKKQARITHCSLLVSFNLVIFLSFPWTSWPWHFWGL